jgi:hypothetical protein
VFNNFVADQRRGGRGEAPQQIAHGSVDLLPFRQKRAPEIHADMNMRIRFHAEIRVAICNLVRMNCWEQGASPG